MNETSIQPLSVLWCRRQDLLVLGLNSSQYIWNRADIPANLKDRLFCAQSFAERCWTAGEKNIICACFHFNAGEVNHIIHYSACWGDSWEKLLLLIAKIHHEENSPASADCNLFWNISCLLCRPEHRRRTLRWLRGYSISCWSISRRGKLIQSDCT